MKLPNIIKNEVYMKYFDSDIFNLNSINTRKEPIETVKFRKIHIIPENTKEDIFCIGKQKRIKRDLIKNDEFKSKSVGKKHKYCGESDIFFHKRAGSYERRKGVKLMPEILNKSTFLYEKRNVDEFNKDLKEYQLLHRDTKNNYNVDKYFNRISTNERYFKAYYDDNITFNKEENQRQKEEQLKKYIHNKKYLKKEIMQLNDTLGERNINKSKEKRYIRQIRNKSDEKRFFADSSLFPKYNCSINRQIQMESNIFNNPEKKEKDFFEDAKEIYHRLEQAKKNYNKNNKRLVLNNLNKQTKNIDLKNGHKKINTNVDNLQYSTNTISYTRNMKDINLLNNSNNYDLITGKEIDKKVKNEKKEKNDNKKIEEAIDSIPNLNERNKLRIRMKTSVLELNTDKDLAKKRKEFIDYYKNNSDKKRKNNYITLKIGETNNNLIDNDDNMNKKPSEKYIMTYTTNSEFDKFDSNEIKNIFIKNGIQAYNFENKNKMNDFNVKNISFKLKGQDEEKINLIENDFKKEKYKLKIRKENNLKNANNVNEKTNKAKRNSEEKRFKIIPKDVLLRKGFVKQFTKY